MRTLTILVLAVLLTACGSSPSTSYYLIDSLPGTDGVHAQTGPIIGLERIQLPGYLDASTILHRRDNQRLAMNQSERWGEPMPTAVPRILSANLVSLLPAYRVVLQPWSRQQQPDIRLIVTVQELLAHDGDAVQLSASWQLLQGDKVTSRQGLFRAALSNNSPDSIARAHGEALEKLARAIAADIQPGD